MSINNENRDNKMNEKDKENIITIIVENITVKNDIKSLRTI